MIRMLIACYLAGARIDRARLTIVLADVLLIMRQNKYRNLDDPSPMTFKNLYVETTHKFNALYVPHVYASK